MNPWWLHKEVTFLHCRVKETTRVRVARLLSSVSGSENPWHQSAMVYLHKVRVWGCYLIGSEQWVNEDTLPTCFFHGLWPWVYQTQPRSCSNPHKAMAALSGATETQTDLTAVHKRDLDIRWKGILRHCCDKKPPYWARENVKAHSLLSEAALKHWKMNPYQLNRQRFAQLHRITK